MLWLAFNLAQEAIRVLIADIFAVSELSALHLPRRGVPSDCAQGWLRRSPTATGSAYAGNMFTGASRMAPPTSTRISARPKRVQGLISHVNVIRWCSAQAGRSVTFNEEEAAPGTVNLNQQHADDYVEEPTCC